MTELETELLAALKDGLSLAGGWREAIVELEDWCHERVRLKNMLAAADQLDRWAAAARAAIAKAEGATKAEGRCSLCGKPWPFVVPCMWGGCPMGADL
jgi:hypothetical protein